jgi:hypothetical protein
MPLISSTRSSYGPKSLKISYDVIRNSLQLYLDAANISSYSGSGSFWFDISNNSRSASVFGTSRWQQTFEGIFDFENISQTTDYISLPNTALQTVSQDYTLQTLMRPTSASVTAYFHSMASSLDTNLLILGQNGASAFLFFWNDQLAGNIPFSNNETLLLTVVRNGQTTSFYKNEAFQFNSGSVVAVQNVAQGGWILNQEQDAIGGGFDPTQNYRGGIISVLFYNRAISQQEITNNVNFFRSRRFF